MKKEIHNAIIAGQFTNEANPLSHYETTGPENKGKTIVCLLTDTGERYLSTALLNN